MNTTSQNMLEFFAKAASSGRIKPNVASNMATVARKVLEIEENWEQLDISQLDVEDFLTRFRNLRGLEYKQDSLVEYERRFRRAIAMYLEYIRNPTGWKYGGPVNTNRNGGTSRKDKSSKVSETKSGYGSSTESLESASISVMANGVHMMDYPFPLRDGCIVRLRLPADLKVSEVERLAAFMRTVAIDFGALVA
mgnify:CR=1 FL=1